MDMGVGVGYIAIPVLVEYLYLPPPGPCDPSSPLLPGGSPPYSPQWLTPS